MGFLSACQLMVIKGQRSVASSRPVSVTADYFPSQLSRSTAGDVGRCVEHVAETCVLAKKIEPLSSESHQKPWSSTASTRNHRHRRKGLLLPETQSLLAMACLGGLGHPDNVRNGFEEGGQEAASRSRSRSTSVL